MPRPENEIFSTSQETDEIQMVSEVFEALKHIFQRYTGENTGGIPQTFNNACKHRHFEI
jgi:flagellar biosynthesis regulator FlbT